MRFTRGVWDQLKNLTADRLVAALKKDGWKRRHKRGAALSFTKLGRDEPIAIHYHPGKTYGPRLLRNLLADIRWDEDDLRRLRLIRWGGQLGGF